MHGNNGKKSNWGPQPDGTWIPSDRLEFVGPNKEKNRAEWERTNSKPSTQLGSSSSTSASSSKNKSK
ncbi:hypothetical protein [Wolbachia pipientis]|uniref:hypothetical protein n=1 Tax=Wolbachia pipientis TaxID=955 RepID=UPI00202E5D4C|nr:hypothetical protein [Wolbachia pipientis]MCM1001860.1 hypothetical protein [Wolbachia pipientis]